MINLLSNGDRSVERVKNEKNNFEKDNTQVQSEVDDTKIKITYVDQSKLSLEHNGLEDYRKQLNENSVSLKNISYEKPAEVYKNYIKE